MSTLRQALTRGPGWLQLTGPRLFGVPVNDESMSWRERWRRQESFWSRDFAAVRFPIAGCRAFRPEASGSRCNREASGAVYLPQASSERVRQRLRPIVEGSNPRLYSYRLTCWRCRWPGLPVPLRGDPVMRPAVGRGAAARFAESHIPAAPGRLDRRCARLAGPSRRPAGVNACGRHAPAGQADRRSMLAPPAGPRRGPWVSPSTYWWCRLAMGPPAGPGRSKRVTNDVGLKRLSGRSVTSAPLVFPASAASSSVCSQPGRLLVVGPRCSGLAPPRCIDVNIAGSSTLAAPPTCWCAESPRIAASRSVLDIVGARPTRPGRPSSTERSACRACSPRARAPGSTGAPGEGCRVEMCVTYGAEYFMRSIATYAAREGSWGRQARASGVRRQCTSPWVEVPETLLRGSAC
jgi:hypothetical protein